VNGQEGDIYEAVSAAVAYGGANEQISYDDLRSTLQEVLLDSVPQKHEVTRAIQQMCRIARTMQLNNALQRDSDANPDDEDETDRATLLDVQ